jgi:lysozyme family protein
MAPATFDACLALVWQFDGLKQDNAPGEKFATAYGITQMTWDNAVEQGIVEGPIAACTKADCAAILRALYWNTCGCPGMNPGVNLMVFNDAMVCGSGHAARLLQRIVGAAQDGVVGQTTLRLANSYPPGALIDKLKEADETYYASLANADLFLKGWTRREEFMAVQAHLMAGTN